MSFTKINFRRLLAIPVICCSVFMASCDDDNGGDDPITPGGGNGPGADAAARLYVSNDVTAGQLNIFDLNADAALASGKTVQTGAKKGNGIVVAPTSGHLMQVSRDDRQILIFADAANLTDVATPSSSFRPTNVTNARDIAFDEANKLLYISRPSDSTIHVFSDPLALNNETPATKVLKLNGGRPWALHFDSKNNRLIVALDETARAIEVYNNPAALVTGRVSPTATFKIAGATRLHGVAYSSAANTLVVSDIGSTAATATDGKLYIFDNADAVLSGASGEITATRTITGTAANLLSGPVDVAIDDREGKNMVYVAERSANKILGFKLSDNGEAAATVNVAANAPEGIYLDIR